MMFKALTSLNPPPHGVVFQLAFVLLNSVTPAERLLCLKPETAECLQRLLFCCKTKGHVFVWLESLEPYDGG